MGILESLVNNVYLPYFQKMGEEGISPLVNCSVPSIALLSEYKKLESMTDKEMIDMDEYVNELFPDKTEEQKSDATKIIYTIGTLI